MTHPVVLGLGGTVDFELRWDAAVLAALAAEFDIRTVELGGERPIRSERDLVVSVLSFLDRGMGGERFVASSELLVAFAERFGYAITLGGTGVRAGLAALLLGVPSTQHLVSIDDHVRRLLPDGIDAICSADSDTTDPHLIVQYPAGARIPLADGVVATTRSDRLIYVNDPPNRELVLSDQLADALSTASLFLVSGFNSMQDRELLETRVRELRAAMRALPDDALVLFEDAGYHRPAFGPAVLAGLAGGIDVYSLNEDELRARVGHPVDLLAADEVAAALDELRSTAPAPVIVLHTGRYAAVTGPEPERWLPIVEGGVVMSGARYLHGDAMTADHLRELAASGRRSEAGRALVEALASRTGSRVLGVPAFDLETASPTTIGLGDTFVGGMVAAFELERRARG
jgi:ADP-dependent phosphofructokinase/glucokinase